MVQTMEESAFAFPNNRCVITREFILEAVAIAERENITIEEVIQRPFLALAKELEESWRDVPIVNEPLGIITVKE